jgi:hypothetical protein
MSTGTQNNPHFQQKRLAKGNSIAQEKACEDYFVDYEEKKRYAELEAVIDVNGNANKVSPHIARKKLVALQKSYQIEERNQT